MLWIFQQPTTVFEMTLVCRELICKCSEQVLTRCSNSCLIECSPPTAEARVRFPAETCQSRDLQLRNQDGVLILQKSYTLYFFFQFATCCPFYSTVLCHNNRQLKHFSIFFTYLCTPYTYNKKYLIKIQILRTSRLCKKYFQTLHKCTISLRVQLTVDKAKQTVKGIKHMFYCTYIITYFVLKPRNPFSRSPFV